ncbi:MAG: PfkB family carbohydrate kinase [Geminicoccaceae bacterium]
MAEVVVTGSLHLDLMLDTPQRPGKGETVKGRSWHWKPGGKGGNQAVAAAGHGAATAMIGRIGDDDFGRRQLARLRAAGVDMAAIGTDPEHGSGMSVAMIGDDGDYSAVIVSGANLHIDEGQIEAASPLLQQTRVLLLQNEVNPDANLLAARAARRGPAVIVLNAAPAAAFDPALAGLVDILLVNEHEGAALGGDPLDHAPALVTTLGERGLVVRRRNAGPLAIDGHRVELVDTHGAGDCFAGALAARLARGDEIEAALHYANAAAALHVSCPEVERTQIGENDVRAFLERKQRKGG